MSLESTNLYDIECQLEKKMAQLDAMLAIPCGLCGDAFKRLEDTQQHHFLWACADLFADIRATYDYMRTRETAAFAGQGGHAG